jgi:hypothetical protein
VALQGYVCVPSRISRLPKYPIICWRIYQPSKQEEEIIKGRKKGMEKIRKEFEKSEHHDKKHKHKKHQDKDPQKRMEQLEKESEMM